MVPFLTQPLQTLKKNESPQPSAPSSLRPEQRVIAALKSSPGRVFDPQAEDELSPPPLASGPVAGGKCIVQRATHTSPYVNVACRLSVRQ